MNMTNTRARLIQALQDVNKTVTNPSQEIREAFDESIIQVGVLTLFFPDTCRAECRLLNTDEVVSCRVLQHYTGGLFSQFTPDGDYDYKDNEVIIHPRREYYCLLIRLNHPSADYVLLGYYYNENKEFKPIGSVVNGARLSCIGSVDDYYLEFENGTLRGKIEGLDLNIGGNNDFKPYNQSTLEELIELKRLIKRNTDCIILVNKRLHEFHETVTKQLNDLDERVKILEGRKRIIMGRYKIDGEGELEESEVIELVQGKHSLGCILEGYKKGEDDPKVVFKYTTVTGETVTNERTLDENGKAYLNINIKDSYTGTGSIETNNITRTKTLKFNQKTKTLKMGRLAYDGTGTLVEGKTKIEVTGGQHSIGLDIQDYDPNSESDTAVFLV